MRMKNKFIAFLTLLLLCFTMIFVFPVSAFDGNDYGGSSDFSSSDSDTSGSITVAGFLLFLGIVAVIVGLFILIGYISFLIKYPNNDSKIEEIIKKHDPSFSSAEFINFTKQFFIDIQLAWCARDLESLRAVLHENLYNTTKNQINEKIKQGVIYHYDKFNFDYVHLIGYTFDEKSEYITAYVDLKMSDWQEDEKTHKLLRGDKDTQYYLKYKMKFMRSLDIIDKIEPPTCPSCAALIESSSTTKCKYCGSEVRGYQHGWILCEFSTVTNDTVFERIQK